MRALIRPVIVLGCLASACWRRATRRRSPSTRSSRCDRSGVTDTVILALIDRDRTVFAIEPEQIVALQRDGLSERVILAMLKSGREEGDQQARAESANNSAWIMSNLATEPISISVGHGPDRPNTPHIDGFYSGPPAAAFSTAPYYGPAFRYRKPQPFNTRRASEPRALCYAQISTQRSSQPGVRLSRNVRR